MPFTCETGIFKSRVQAVLCEIEDVCTEFKMPDPAVVGNYIVPAGDAVANQTPESTNSEEKADTLDILDQFPNALPPGEFTVPMYLRCSGNAAGQLPQGSPMFESLQGDKQIDGTYTLNTDIDAVATTVILDAPAAGASVPAMGILTLPGGEKLMYSTATKNTDGTYTLTNVTRGYMGTTPESALAGAVFTLPGILYFQTISKKSFSMVIKTDQFHQYLAGCVANTGNLSVSNEGAVMIEMVGQCSSIATAAQMKQVGAVAGGVITVDDGKLVTAGAYLWNSTNGDDNGGVGFLVSAVNVETNAVTLVNPADGTPAAPTGSADDVWMGFWPGGSVAGEAILSRKTEVFVDYVPGSLRTGDLAINAPAEYITDEVGTEFPEGYMETVREITMSLNTYFRNQDARYFYDGLNAVKVPIQLIYGDTEGYMLDVMLQRMATTTPAIGFEAPAVVLNMDGTALGKAGEDSCDMWFR